MDKEQIKQEITQLRALVKKYQYEYYVLSQPTASDLEYDALFDKLLALEKENPEFDTLDSPTKRVGSDLSQDFPFFEHKIPVLSLDKCYTIEELESWIEKIQRAADKPLSFVVEEKIDGASIVLYYEKGVLVNAVTRGNGSIGNDITGNVKTIGAVPLKLSEPVTVAVRGEIFLPKKDFARINDTMEVPYANPRNLASGSLRRIKSSEVAKIPLDIYVYEGFFENPGKEHIDILNYLNRLGFKLNKRTRFFSDQAEQKSSIFATIFTTGTIKEIESFVANTVKIRHELDHEIDGLVVKVNEIAEREHLGYTGHHPRWALAFKFESPAGITEVLDIQIQIGRTGRVTPVAHVKPVEISGSVISRVTLHNQEYINILELGIGDKVNVEKRGDVIPSVTQVIEHSDNPAWQMALQCPACDTPLVKRGAHHFCPNPGCPDIVKGRLQFFAAKSQMDIENLGFETIAFLYENQIIKDIDDIYTFNPDELLNFPGFGEKKVQLIKDGIAKSLTRPYQTVLQSLGIPELGPKVAELLIDNGITSIEALYKLADDNDINRLVSIQGIGEKTATNLLKELKDDVLRRRIAALKQAGLAFAATEKAASVSEELRVFKDQVWCVTGSFDNFKPRDVAMDLVKKYGGRIVTGITGKTTHLLAGTEAGSKLQKAESLGVTIVSEAQFLEMLKGLYP